jgi:glycerol-3-phosphate O-acyltransferase
VGAPMRIAPWLASQMARHGDVLWLPREQRLPVIQTLCDEVMTRIGAMVPVTAVSLACAAIQSFDRDFIPRAELLTRMEEMRDVLVELNARVLRADRDIAETFDRAWRMLEMRRILAETGGGFAVLPGSRELISYYANGIAHLLGPFQIGVRARDALPIERASGSYVLAR